SSFDTQSFSFSKPQEDQTFSILSTDVNPKLQKFCGKIDYPIECLTSIIPFLDENVDMIPMSILKAEIDAIHNKTKEVKQRILDAISMGDANELSMELSHNMEHVFA
ncbi:hypothetical protein Godav_016466, partial [Gossypium davidsonii]|nr:hypothetical protein [Gossypium davidsonii]